MITKSILYPRSREKITKQEKTWTSTKTKVGSGAMKELASFADRSHAPCALCRNRENKNIWRKFSDYRWTFFLFCDHEKEQTAGATGRQVMLTPIRYLIPLLSFRKVRAWSASNLCFCIYIIDIVDSLLLSFFAVAIYHDN